MGFEIDNEYTAVLLIEILFEKGLVNRQTYINAKKRLNSHISQTAGDSVQYRY